MDGRTRAWSRRRSFWRAPDLRKRVSTSARASPGITRCSAAAVVLLAAFVVTGCSGTAVPQTNTASPKKPSSAVGSSTIPVPAPTPTPEPSLIPGGGAAANLPFFLSINSKFLATNPTPGGRAVIDTLVAAGFVKADMQVTPDKTTIGNDVDSVQFSVRFADGCLIGQTSSAGFRAINGPTVAGNCLIGLTRAIDW